MSLTWRGVLAVLLLAAPSLGQEDFDQWYVLELMGQRSGWMHVSQETEGERIESTTEMVLSLRRGQAAIDVRMDQTWVETVEGEPVELTTLQKLGAEPVTRTYTFGDGSIDVVTEAGGARQQTTMAVPEGDWMTPAQAARTFQGALEAGRTSISQTLLQPDLTTISVITTTYSDIEETTVDVLGKTVPAYRATVTNDQFPDITSVSYLDEHGNALRDEMDMGFATLTTIAADKSLALSKLDPPEVMASTFVEPTGRFDGHPRSLRRTSYLLSMAEGELPELPETGVQRVERINEREARVIVDLDDVRPAEVDDPDAYLTPTHLVDSSDERIVALARKASVEGSAARRAEALRQYVYDYVEEKDLGVGFATASEVCRTRKGDCSEHAVLLAAMLRAEGIPSRTVSGLVYVDSFQGHRRIFGYHMWTQALLDVNGEPTWVDLDATFPDHIVMDATHIALGVASMADDEAFDGLVGMVPLMGNLEIEIE